MSASEAIDHPFILNKQKTSYEGLLYKNLNLFQISCSIWRMIQNSNSPNSYHRTKMNKPLSIKNLNCSPKSAQKPSSSNNNLSNMNGTNEMISIKTNKKTSKRQIILHKRCRSLEITPIQSAYPSHSTASINLISFRF